VLDKRVLSKIKFTVLDKDKFSSDKLGEATISLAKLMIGG